MKLKWVVELYKVCENTKNYKYAYSGSNKVLYGACKQKSEEFIFEYAKLDFCQKKNC